MIGFRCSGTIRPRTKITISAGTSVTDRSAAAAMAKVLVKASGPNIRPSCASSVKIGRKETVMTSRLKNSAGPTSLAASIRISTRGLSGGARSRCLWAFSIMTMAASIMAPTAMAMPPRLMMLEPSPIDLHRREGHQDADRQHQDGDQRAAQMQQEHDADERDDDALLDQRALQRLDRPVDQLGAVVDRHDLDALRQARPRSRRAAP